MELPHEVWDLRKRKHDREKHHENRTHYEEDPSCIRCYPVTEINEKFRKFWKWYNKRFEGKTYTSITCNMLEGLINDNDITNNRNRGAQVRMDRLIGSIKYSKRINDTKDEIKRKIIDKIVFTEGFSLGKEELKRKREEFMKHIEGASEDSLSDAQLSYIEIMSTEESNGNGNGNGFHEEMGESSKNSEKFISKEELKERMLKIRREKDSSNYAEELRELFEDCEKNNLQIDMDTFMKLLKELNLELEEVIDEGAEADIEIEIEYEKEISEEKESSSEEELLDIDNEQEVERTLQELESINTEQKDSSVKNSESESSGK